MYFPSKKDRRYSFSVIISIFLLFVSTHQLPGNYIQIGYAVCLVIFGFSLWIWLTTGYEISRDEIRVKSGPFRSTINIQEIKMVSSFENMKVSFGPALSSDRLEIIHGKHGNVLVISPVNKNEFIKELVDRNPHIHLDEGLIHTLENEVTN